MKRALSLILSVAMLIGLLPAISLAGTAAAAASDTIVYDFTVSAVSDESIIHTDDKNTQSVQFSKVTETSQLNADVSSGLWTYVASPGFATASMYKDYIQARVNPANIDANGLVLKTSFAEAATYSASVKYNKNAANGRSDIYFVPAATATSNSWDMTTADGINGAIADSKNANSTVKLAASVDMHPNATDSNPFAGNTFDVSAGDYYIVLKVDDDTAKGASDRYFSMITSITLKKTVKRETVESPKYFFTCTAFGQANTFSAPLSLDYTLDSSVSTGYYSWVSQPNIKTANFMAGHISFYTANYTPNKDNALILKLTLDTDGTYVPSIDYDKNAYQGLLDMYLIKSDYAATKGWNSFDNSTIASQIAAFDAESSMTDPSAKVLHVASVDQNSNASANATNKIAEKLNLTAGEYYLYLVISKGECENTVHNNPRMYGDLKYLTLTKEESGGNEGGNTPSGEAKSLKYEFTLAGSGEDLSAITETNALFNSKRKLITAGDGNSDTEPGDDWTYLGMSGNYTNTADMRYITQLLEQGIWGYASSNSYNVIGLNAIGFKINVPADGTYTPKVNYLPQSGMGKLYAYIIDDAVNGKTHTNYAGSTKTWNFETAPANSLSYAMQTLRTDNTYGMPEEMKLAVSGEDTNLISYPTEIRTFTGEPMALTAGTYYIIFSQDCSSRRYTYINSFELTVPGGNAGGEEEEPTLSGEVDSYTYTFTKTGRSDASGDYLEDKTGAWEGSYKKLPESPKHFGENWAFAGNTHTKASNKSAMVAIGGTYAGTGQTGAPGEWIAFRVKAPYTTKYLISDVKAYTYWTASGDVDIYIAPMDEKFTEGNAIYGTVYMPEGGEYANRKDQKTFSELGLTNATLIGNVNMYANRSGGDALKAENGGIDSLEVSEKAIFELEKNKEYIIFFVNNATDKAVTLNSLKLSYEVPPIPDLDTITATFGKDETLLVGSKLKPSVKYYGEGEELNGSAGTVSFEIIANDDGALIEAENGDVYAKKPGSATLRVSGTLDGITKTVDVTVTIAADDSFSGVSRTYNFYQDAYNDGKYAVTVTGAENGDPISEADFKTSKAIDYSAQRPWAFVSAVASRPDSKDVYFGQNASYMDLSGMAGEWLAIKVKVPAPGKYSVDLCGYTYKNAGRVEVYMTPYTEDMTFSYVSDNIGSLMTADNFIAEADFNDSSASSSINQPEVGTFVADSSLDWTNGEAEYLMILKTCASKKNSSKSAVLLHSVGLVGGKGISSLEAKADYTTIGVGESTKITDVIAKNAGGSVLDISGAYVEHSVAEGSEGILKLNADGKSFTALAEGTATIETLVLIEGSSVTTKTEITVDDKVGIKNAYLYCPEMLQPGKVASFLTRLELNNRKIIADGEIVGFEVSNESEAGVLEVSADGKKVTAKKAGTAEVKARVLARGNVFETDTIVVTVGAVEMNYPTTFAIDFREGTYQGDSASSLFALTNYTAARNWIFHKIEGISSSYPDISLAGSSGTYSQIVFKDNKDTNYLAFKVIFPSTGNYTVDVTGYCRNRAAKLDLFVIPATEENEARLPNLLDVNGEYYFGSADTYRATAATGVKNSFGTKAITSAGEYIVVFRVASGLAKENNGSFGDAWYPLYIDFVNASTLYRADLEVKEGKTSIEIGEKIQLFPKLYGGDGADIPYDDTVEVIWNSSDANIARINAEGVVTGINEGKAEITAMATKDGATVVSRLEVKVFDNSGIDMNEEIKVSYNDTIYAYGATDIEVSIAMNSGRWVTVPSEYITYTVTDGEGIVSVSEDGVVTGVDEGDATISLTIDPSWKDGIENLEVPDVNIAVVWDMTVDPAVFTLRERENAKINAGRYDWARAEVNAAKAKADKYVDILDTIYDRIVPEGLPRYYHIGHKYDPLKFYCRYCGCNVGLEYGSYAWKANALQSPWKVQCPDCNRKFPSNDFESFYKLGLSDDKAYWNYDIALMRHHELFVCENLDENGKCTCQNVPHPTNDRMSEAWKAFYGFGIGYLENKLYPEMDEKLGVVGWGVDDSLGYKQPYISAEKAREIAGPDGDINDVPGYYPTYYEKDGYAYYTDSSGGPVQYTYVAFYVHDGIWYGAGTSTPLVKDAIRSLIDAFIYTGEAKYGRAGAILLDRVADVYPGFEWYDWANFRGDAYRGKEVDTVWSTGNATIWAEGVDAFLPIYNDPYVVNYLSKKAPRYEVDEKGNWIYDENGEKIPVNLKDSPGALRKHVEKNILDEVFYSVKNGKIIGNFGMHQKAVATAALAYNRLPETKEMLDWILAPGVNYNTGPQQEKEIAGGQILKNLIEEVNRDGIGNENAPGYNRGWITNLITVADLLAGYELYSEADLFENVKFTKMFLGIVRLTLGGYYGTQTGDSGATGSTGIVLQIDDSLIAYKHTRDRVLAQAMYLRNEESTEGLRGTILDDDPEAIAKEIEQIIKEDGGLHLDSEMLTGYGFAALRAGADYDSVSDVSRNNNTRDMAIYFGANTGHGHADTMNLFMSAFGLNVAPDLGYPEQTGSQPNRYEWVHATISHNTVIVDEQDQNSSRVAGIPYHFDDSGKVKVMDITAPNVYPQTEEYRRTVFMIEANDDISYGVDFFHILGGSDHLYS
ncbi:MAG: hypothetical protein E7473_01815, partial [Ruminococcaceae bacterium]|nr:hypothetical protein [Oscillospiraceae bacterium]